MVQKKRGRPVKSVYKGNDLQSLIEVNAASADPVGWTFTPAPHLTTTYSWHTIHGGYATVRQETLDKAKERFGRTQHDNDAFIRQIQQDIDRVAARNPLWDMQQVIEAIAN